MNEPSLSQPTVHRENSSVEMPLRTVTVRNLTARETFFPRRELMYFKWDAHRDQRNTYTLTAQGQYIATLGLSYSYLNNID